MGKSNAMSTSPKDTSERFAQKNSELESQLKQFRMLVEKNPQGMLVFRDGRLLFANQAFANLLGFETPENLLVAPRLHALDRSLPSGYSV